MNRRVLIGIAGVALTVVLVAAGVVGISAKPKVYHVNQNLNSQDIPPKFKASENLKAGRDMLGLDLASASQADARIELTFQGTESSEGLVNVNGQGVLRVGSSSFPFTLDQKQRLKKATLSTGQTVVYGPLDGTIKGRTGDNLIAMALVCDSDSKAAEVTVTIGDLGKGFSALHFGQGLMTAEVISLFSQANPR